MTETPGVYNVGTRPQPPPTFEMQHKTLPPAVRSMTQFVASNIHNPTRWDYAN
jgi:hypothetical protein